MIGDGHPESARPGVGKGTNRVTAAAWLLIAATMACAQTPPLNQRDRLAIDRAKNALVSTFDKRLPKVTLEYFLKRESDGGRIEWEVNDCGEQTGNPAVDRGRDFPICAQAMVSGRNRRTATIMVGVGTHKKGVTGTPELFSVTITDENGLDHPARLFDLPAQMHPQRRKKPNGPRDSPPAGLQPSVFSPRQSRAGSSTGW